MATLVTGAGMVGSLVAAQLLERGESPVLFDVAFSMPNLADRLDLDAVQLVRGDITEISEVIDVIKRHDIRRIIHTAGLLSSAMNERPVAGIRVNLMGTAMILEAARLCGVERVVFCSSGSTVLGFPFKAGEPVGENVALRAVDQHPPNPYSSMKLACEWLCHNYREIYGLSTVCVRPAGVFGPWIGMPTGQPAVLMRTMVEGGWRDGAVRMGAADMSQAIDYVYASDVARGLVLADAHDSPPSPVYNISMGVTHSVPEVIKIVSHQLGREVTLESTSGQRDTVSYSSAPTFDITAARTELGYEPSFPMEAAVADYLRWLDKHQV